MKRYSLLNSISCLTFLAIFFFIGCSDKLLPPGDDDTQNNPNKITLKGDVIEETPLPDDAKVVLVWGISTGGDYLFVHGRGTIDRANNTFEIPMDQPPPPSAINWPFPGNHDTGIGFAVIMVVPQSVPEDQIIDNGDDLFEAFYGAVDSTNLLYFTIDSNWSWQHEQDICHIWVKQFTSGYTVGHGVPKLDGCTFEGFRPIRSDGLKLIINSDENRFTFVDWT